MKSQTAIFQEALRLFCEDLNSYLTETDDYVITPEFGNAGDTDAYWYDHEVHFFSRDLEVGVMIVTLYSNDDGGPSTLTVHFDPDEGDILVIVQAFDTTLRAIVVDEARSMWNSRPLGSGGES
jgi:hypothetical protein